MGTVIIIYFKVNFIEGYLIKFPRNKRYLFHLLIKYSCGRPSYKYVDPFFVAWYVVFILYELFEGVLHIQKS